MSSEKNTDAEMLIQKGYKLKIPQLMHQPVVIAVDVNNSMNTMEAGQQKTNLKLIQDVINQIGQDSELKEEDKKNKRYLRREFSYAKFQQALVLPDDVEKDKISANVSDGVLNITLPKRTPEEKAKVNRVIEIQ